jgi:tripartite ATP-independent transporter DctP family solute receptor
MKKHALLTLLCLVMVLGVGMPGAAMAETIEVAHVFATDHPVHQSLLMADKWLQEKSNGKYNLKIYPSTTYASQKNSIRAVMLGTLDVFIVVNAIDYYKPAGVMLAPYTFRDYDHWKKFKNTQVYEDLLAATSEAMKVKQLALFTFGFRHATTKSTQAKTPEDFKGLKLRVVNFPPYPEAANVLGAVGVPIPFAELYMALSTGVVDGQENPFTQIYYQKFYEQQKYLILTGHMLATDGWMMSKKRWNSFDDADKKLVAEAFRKSADFIDDETIKQEQALLAKLKKEGMVVIEPDRTPFMERAKEVLKKYPDWTDLYNKIQAIK